jgi:hypothetical protein
MLQRGGVTGTAVSMIYFTGMIARVVLLQGWIDGVTGSKAHMIPMGIRATLDLQMDLATAVEMLSQLFMEIIAPLEVVMIFLLIAALMLAT